MALEHHDSASPDIASDVVDRFVAGDRKAFDALVAPFRAHLVAIARRRVAGNCAADVEDALQDGLLKAWIARKRFRGLDPLAAQGRLASFVKAAAMHLARARCRRNLRVGPGRAVDVARTAVDPITERPGMETTTFRYAVRVVLWSLTPEMTYVLLQHHVMGHTALELANPLGVSDDTARRRVLEAEDAFCLVAEQHGFEGGTHR